MAENWKACLVHGNDAEVITYHNSAEQARDWGIRIDALHHQGNSTLTSDPFWVKDEKFWQFGTDYHYLCIERVHEPGCPMAPPTNCDHGCACGLKEA